MLSHPKISVVTPSYNQGQFIEETILSVLGQHYPNLEYIIIDGGSTDNTIEIIRKYEKHISYWISEKDGGQSQAINKGFKVATGDIFCWLNSDDMFMPHTLDYIYRNIDINEAGICFGNCIHFKEDVDGVTSWGSDVVNMSVNTSLDIRDFIIQPSSFWSKKVWELVGPLREDVHFAFDWEWFLRAERQEIKLNAVSKCLSLYRYHKEHKTGSGGLQRQQEILKLYKAYSARYAELYEMLMNEKSMPVSILAKIKTMFFKNLYSEPKKPECFKKLSPRKYKDYSEEEIASCYYML